MVQELHNNEQYFFDKKTLNSLAEFLENYNSICCLCCPTLGLELNKRGKNVKILDIDTRFSDNENFRYYDLNKPTWINERFEIIICDPPFHIIKISQIFHAIRQLSHHDYKQKILISFLKRRELAILSTFINFSLTPTNFFPSYSSLIKHEKHEFRLYSNLSKNEIDKLEN